jgi:hypothetical protein
MRITKLSRIPVVAALKSDRVSNKLNKSNLLFVDFGFDDIDATSFKFHMLLKVYQS